MGITAILLCDRCGHQETGSKLKENWTWLHFEELASYTDIETGEKGKPYIDKGKKLLCPDCTRIIGNWLLKAGEL